VEKQLATPLPASSCCLAWNANKMSPALKWVLDYLGDTEKLHREWLA
jgi:DNA-binding transcriptional LysR family regulator